MQKQILTMTVYRCVNKRCRQYHQEFTAMPIAGAVQATGRRVSCQHCGEVVFFIRNVFESTPAVTN